MLWSNYTKSRHYTLVSHGNKILYKLSTCKFNTFSDKHIYSHFLCSIYIIIFKNNTNLRCPFYLSAHLIIPWLTKVQKYCLFVFCISHAIRNILALSLDVCANDGTSIFMTFLLSTKSHESCEQNDKVVKLWDI